MKKEMLMAHFKISPVNFIKNSLMNALIYSITISILALFVSKKFFAAKGFSDLFSFSVVIFIVFPILFLYLFTILLKAPFVAIKKRRKDIDKDVLFAGRYLLVKINSGKPLLNSLIDASKTFGVGSKYFKEIVDDVTLGMPIEDAIDRAMDLSPSPAFQKILFQINNSLKIGVDISETLANIIEEITSEQLNEIESYSSKLNSVALFYMMLATVVPSLGLTIFVVVAVIIGFQITNAVYVILWMVVVIMQLFFINLFHSIRPNINF